MNDSQSMNIQLELGLDTFGDVTRTADGIPESQAQVIRNVVQQAVLADQLGIDFFGVGEHHRADFAVSSPEIVLAGAPSAADKPRVALGRPVQLACRHTFRAEQHGVKPLIDDAFSNLTIL